MKVFQKVNRAALAVAGAATFFAGPSLAFDLTGKGFVQYGDAQSYSLPVLQLQQCGKLGAGPGGSCPYFVNSSPGQIKGLTVLGTGPAGSDVVTNFDGMDNAYSTPNSSGIPFWRTETATYRGTTGTVNNNGANTWDTTLAALKTYLTTQKAGGPEIEQMIFFFNNNQEKSGGTNNQSLAAWAQITVKDAGGAIIGVYDFTNMGGKYATPAEGGGGVLSTSGGNVGSYTHAPANTPTNPKVGDRNSTDYVLSGGQLCLVTFSGGGLTAGDLLNCGSVTQQQKQSKQVIVIDHNLGANEAAYALLFPELNTQLMGLFTNPNIDLSLYTMSVDIRLGCDPNDYDGAGGPDAGLSPTSTVCVGNNTNGYGRNLNNGYEQIFISKGSDVVNVPEPGSLLLAGLALAGLAGLRRRR